MEFIFHIIFTEHEMLLFFWFFFNHLKNLQPSLAHGSNKNRQQERFKVWASLPNPDLNKIFINLKKQTQNVSFLGPRHWATDHTNVLVKYLGFTVTLILWGGAYKRYTWT